MHAEVDRFVTTCHSCQRNKTSNRAPAGKLQPLPIPGRRWECVSMDLITQLPCSKNGHTAIAVFVDKLSKMVHFQPCATDSGALAFANHMVTAVFRLHGIPKTIISDRDPRFVSKFWEEVCRLLGTKQALSSAYHPESDGQTERVNRVLEDVLRHYVSPQQDDWDTYLPMAEFAINNSWHESTGCTPFFLNYGQHPHTPASVQLPSKVPAALQFTAGINAAVRRAKELLHAAQSRQKQYADRKRREETYVVGDDVLLATKNVTFKNPGTKKLLPRFIGPFKVAKVISPVAYRLTLPESMQCHDVFHVSLLRRYKSDGRTQPPPPPMEVEGEFEYEVEAILADRPSGRRGAQREFLLKWKGYGPENNTWEPEGNLSGCRQLLAEYLASSRRRN